MGVRAVVMGMFRGEGHDRSGRNSAERSGNDNTCKGLNCAVRNRHSTDALLLVTLDDIFNLVILRQIRQVRVMLSLV